MYNLTKGTREERERAKEYENSAQIASIMGRGCYTLIMNHQLHNFALRHEQYVHPRYILESDNITLQGITDSHAFFCVSGIQSNRKWGENYFLFDLFLFPAWDNPPLFTYRNI